MSNLRGCPLFIYLLQARQPVAFILFFPTLSGILVQGSLLLQQQDLHMADPRAIAPALEGIRLTPSSNSFTSSEAG